MIGIKHCFKSNAKVGIVMATLLLLSVMLLATTANAAEKQIKMDIYTAGSRTDASWSARIYEAYLYIKEKYPDVKVTFSDLIPFADAPSILEAKSQMGVDLIYSDSTIFEAIQKVAPKYPKTWFVISNIVEAQLKTLPENCTTYASKDEQGGFLAGVAAGMVTKTNKLGYIAGYDYPDIIRAGKGFEEGAKLVNPDIQLLVLYTGDWVDIQKGYEAAKALIDSGADVIMHYSDNAGKGLFRAAQDNNIYVIGEARDQIEFAPNLMITSFLIDHPRLAEKALLDFKAGQIRKTVNEFGIEEGWPVIAPIRNVPPEVEAKVKEVMRAVESGEIKIPVVTDPKALRRLK
jgi:basic membrane lipoprotein Med (substrate-binding protein (PBP1-ABC) superfamily)